MRLTFFLFLISLIGSVQMARAQKISAYNADQLMQRVSNPDTIYVVNFWATWCVPCVEELPSFNMINDLYKGKPVKVLLLSFDFKEQYPAALESWVKKKKLHPEVAWFNETNPTEYIPKIAPTWEGGLPATLFINNKTGEKTVKPDQITTDELKSWIDKQL